ncbi:MAG: PfkB family carbohydrate kinase, partial [Natronomonas sp.]
VFPFETHSVGAPSTVSIHEFSDGDLTYADISDDVADWSHEAFETVPDADAYVCGNWASVDGMTDSLTAPADCLEGRILVFDPGDLTTAPPAEIRDCFAALATLDDAVDVAVSVNGRELTAIADALAVEDGVRSVRDEGGVFAVVRHEADAAAAATRTDHVVVDNVDTNEPTRQTGGGDRFSGGLAHGLAVGGDIGPAVALGNCCASYYVATGTTGTADDIATLATEQV